jgi:hypothetical protein
MQMLAEILFFIVVLLVITDAFVTYLDNLPCLASALPPSFFDLDERACHPQGTDPEPKHY